MKKLILIVCCFVATISAHAQNMETLGSGADELHILTWNIYMRPLALFRNDGQLERAKAIAEQLKDGLYDVIVFQEAFEKKAREILWEGLKEKFPFQIGPGGGGWFKTNSGLWILSKFEFISTAAIEFNTCRIGDCLSKKGAILVEFCKNEKKYQVIGTHLQAEDYPETRREQLTDISEKLLNLYDEEGVPQFIAGDLNTRPDDTENYKSMLSILNAEDSLPQKIKATLKDLKEMVSWGGKSNDLFEADEERTPQLLDYILLRHNGKKPAWVQRSIEVIQQVWNKDRKKKDLSDHYAVAAIIRY